MNLFISLLVRSLAVFVSAYLIPGVNVDSYATALMVAIVLGIINLLIKPILILLTLPINILTLGLFTLVINAALVLLTSSLVSGFKVDGWLSALLFALVLSIVSSFLHSLT